MGSQGFLKTLLKTLRDRRTQIKMLHVGLGSNFWH